MITTNKLIKKNRMAFDNKESTDKAKLFIKKTYKNKGLKTLNSMRSKQIDACVSLQSIVFFITNLFIDDYHGPNSCDISILAWQLQYFVYNLQNNTLHNNMFCHDDIDIDDDIKTNKQFYDKLKENSKFLNRANYTELASYMLGNVVSYEDFNVSTQPSKTISKQAFKDCITFHFLEHMQWNPAGIDGKY